MLNLIKIPQFKIIALTVVVTLFFESAVYGTEVRVRNTFRHRGRGHFPASRRGHFPLGKCPLRNESGKCLPISGRKVFPTQEVHLRVPISSREREIALIKGEYIEPLIREHLGDSDLAEEILDIDDIVTLEKVVDYLCSKEIFIDYDTDRQVLFDKLRKVKLFKNDVELNYRYTSSIPNIKFTFDYFFSTLNNRYSLSSELVRFIIEQVGFRESIVLGFWYKKGVYNRYVSKIDRALDWALALFEENHPNFCNKDLFKYLKTEYITALSNWELQRRCYSYSLEALTSFWYLVFIDLATKYLSRKRGYEDNRDIEIVSAVNLIESYWRLNSHQREGVRELCEDFIIEEMPKIFETVTPLCYELRTSSPLHKVADIERYLCTIYPETDFKSFDFSGAKRLRENI